MFGIRKLVVLAAAGLLAAACSSSSPHSAKAPTPTATSAATPTVPAGLTSFYAQKLSWHSCGSGFQCSTLTVPLNYADPGASSMKLALIKLPATGHKIGSLVTNPGGPGGSGIDFVRQAAGYFGADLRQHFDLVGFDPRGVGSSTPAIRCNSNAFLDKLLETNDEVETQAQLNAVISISKQFASNCKAKDANLLPYVGTTSAAKDMDILRAALGDKGLTYYGASYGTFLGAYYAQLFPHNVRAMVLDGALDPNLTSAQLNIQQAQGFETALRSFTATCVSQGNCPLGTTVDAGVKKAAQIVDAADTKPLRNTSGNGQTIDGAVVEEGIASALYSKQEWPELELGLEAAVRGDGTILLELADELVGRNSDGTYSNQTDANTAINCVDYPYSHDISSWQQQANQAEQAAPDFGRFIVWGGLACAYWPVDPAPAPHPVTAAGAPPIVVVGTTRDPATPYKWAQGLASELTSGVLLSLNGDGHTAYLQGNDCIVSNVDTYLISLKPPAKGTLCR